MIKDNNRYATVVAMYRRVSPNCWECEHSHVEALNPGEVWDDREEAKVERPDDSHLIIQAAFRAEPQGERYLSLVPLPEAQAAADRAFRVAVPNAHLKSLDEPTDTSLLND